MIKISNEYFLKHLIEKLKQINKNLNEVDAVLYENDELINEWQKVRDSNLELDELIDAIE